MLFIVVYGWRSAEIKNLRNMLRDFPRTQQILLEQNYRSTASILGASMAIVAQGMFNAQLGVVMPFDSTRRLR